MYAYVLGRFIGIANNISIHLAWISAERVAPRISAADGEHMWVRVCGRVWGAWSIPSQAQLLSKSNPTDVAGLLLSHMSDGFLIVCVWALHTSGEYGRLGGSLWGLLFYVHVWVCLLNININSREMATPLPLNLSDLQTRVGVDVVSYIYLFFLCVSMCICNLLTLPCEMDM